jgi:hypothetical protein
MYLLQPFFRRFELSIKLGQFISQVLEIRSSVMSAVP